MSRTRAMFQLGKGGWSVAFLEADCQTSQQLKLLFRSEGKIRAMHSRTGASQLSEGRAMLGHGLEIGRGGAVPEAQSDTLDRVSIVIPS